MSSKKKKYSKKQDDTESQKASTSNEATTPNRATNLSEDEYSPYFHICSTQEIQENIDVMWDWNQNDEEEPKTPVRSNKKKKQRKLINNDTSRRLDSPKLSSLFRRHAANNNEQIKQDFNKLREELKALKEELAHNHDEEHFVLSPHEESAFKSIIIDDADLGCSTLQNVPHPAKKDDCVFEDDSVFNDDMEEQLVLCSQLVENNPLKEIDKNLNAPSSRPLLNNYDKDDSIFDDSFNAVLSQIDSEFEAKAPVPIVPQSSKMPVNTQSKKSEIFSRTRSEASIRVHERGKTEWQRTRSIEIETLSKKTLMEIEKKRLEAKARLDAKRQGKVLTRSNSLEIPVKCSAEEIERKRLEARAKLDAKRTLDLIEKKRLEAIKRLEENRKKKAVK